MSAYGPRCRLSSVKGGTLEINANMGMTNAAVLPEPRGRSKPEDTTKSERCC